jgi:hypothetical protein
VVLEPEFTVGRRQDRIGNVFLQHFLPIGASGLVGMSPRRIAGQ